MAPMLSVTLACSDQACPYEVEVAVDFPAEVDVLVCDDCGCLLQAVAFSELATGPAPRARRELRLAAWSRRPSQPLAAKAPTITP